MTSSAIILIVLIILAVVVLWYFTGRKSGNYTFVSSRTIEKIFPEKPAETQAPAPEPAPAPIPAPSVDVSQEPLGDSSVV